MYFKGPAEEEFDCAFIDQNLFPLFLGFGGLFFFCWVGCLFLFFVIH